MILIIAARHGKDVPIAFGPYLAAAGFVALLYGDRIVDFLVVSLKRRLKAKGSGFKV